jgi:hypothetical protein
MVRSQIYDPPVLYFERGGNGDRFQTECRLSEYISNVVKNEEVLAPTFTSYLPEHVQPSLIVEFLEDNVALRSIAKKEAFKAKVAKDMDRYIIKDNEQDNAKRFNNSCSGAFGAQGNVLNNPTAHNTLTSIVRCESSISNASNEKILAGNRHYYSSAVTLNNIIFITSQFDHVEMETVMQRYGLVYPSVEDVAACIRYSTWEYWRGLVEWIPIQEYIDALTPLERAAVVYIGDFYHIRIYNPDVVRTMLAALSAAVTADMEDPIGYIHKADEQIVNVAHQICRSVTAGRGKVYDTMPLADVQLLAGTIQNIESTLASYRDFIRVMFLTHVLPASTAYIPDMMRRVVVLSDTDSTMFSVDEWVQWYMGRPSFTDEAVALASSMMYIATQCIAHELAIFSANLGVARSKLFRIAMKPEFSFPVFAQSSVAKHYYTCTAVKEGNVYAENELEVKGVNLKSSAIPKHMVTDLHARMQSILDTIQAGEPVSLLGELTWVADLEREIIASLRSGDVTYYKQTKIKSAESYSKSSEESPYIHYTLWNRIFMPKYGAISPPPYGVIKIPTVVTNITQLKRWLDAIDDVGLRERLAEWLASRNKRDLGTMYVPTMFVKAYGIPAEILLALDVKRIVLDLTGGHRMFLETLGYFPKTGRMLSELGY